MKNIELLAPAGSFEALKAAVQNGADAVYLGGALFSARAYASNFDEETLKQAVEYAQVRGVKVYVTVNTLIKDKEIKLLLPYIKFLYEIGIDAVILQDLGVVKIVRDVFPDLPIHCSTQMTLHNSQGVEVLKKAGVERVVLARELNLEEIKKIQQNTGMELEVFVHGALCYGYSGQCFMSSFIGGRSGNRGRCAQPCRKQYELIPLENSGTKQEKAFFISMRDLNTLEDIGKVIESGVTSFKIEGRMKKPQYVASIVKAYREAIDQHIKTQAKLLDETTHKEVTQIFNRKFTKGYILDTDKQQILNIQKPNNRGLLLGQVEAYNQHKNTFTITLLETIRHGDGVEVTTNQAEGIGGIANKIYKDNKLTHEAQEGDKVEIELKGKVEKGAKVYKTLDIQLMKRLEATYSHEEEHKRISIYGDVRVKVNEPIELYLWDNEGNTISRKSDVMAEKAKKVALTTEKVKENIKKLGKTPFIMQHITCQIDEAIAIPIAAINKLRRDAVEALIKLRRDKAKRVFKNKEEMNFLMQYADPTEKKEMEKDRAHKLSVKVDTIEQLKAVLTEKVDRIYYGNLKDLHKAIELCKDKGVQVFFRSPPIVKDDELKLLQDKIKDYALDGVLAGDLAMLAFAKEDLNISAMADISLNVMNSNTIDFLMELGSIGITISPELDLKSIQTIDTQFKPAIETIIYGKLMAMITETCPLTNSSKCDQACEGCRKGLYTYRWGLKDDKNISFPFCKDYLGRTIILNSKPIHMLDKLKDIYTTNISHYRLEFTDESPETIIKIMRTYGKGIKDPLTINNRGEVDALNLHEFTRGHFYRGIE